MFGNSECISGIVRFSSSQYGGPRLSNDWHCLIGELTLFLDNVS